MNGAYYNENDRHAAAWLRELIKRGLIADGDVDERSIVDVQPEDLDGYTQCHFFAGIGGWSYALRLAGWPDDRPVWTGSCPCQPWSVGNVWQGGGAGRHDSRHLWPAWLRLIRECEVDDLLGEQVANAIGKGWLDRVLTDLEDEDYACGATVLPACCVGARHERKRIFWCAYASGARRERHQQIAGIPFAAEKTLAVDGNPLARAWSALDGNISGLLHSDGLSVVMERESLRGYGNAIVPQAAAAFIQAYLEAREQIA